MDRGDAVAGGVRAGVVVGEGFERCSETGRTEAAVAGREV